MVDARQRSNQADSPLSILTKREREVLSMIGEGHSLPEIARRLYRSLKTIESHRLSLGRKLQVNNRVELARIAIQEGLSPLPGVEVQAQRMSQDVREQVVQHDHAWEALQAIESSISPADGQKAFDLLVESMCQHLAVDVALVLECCHDSMESWIVSQCSRIGDVTREMIDLKQPPLSDVYQERYVEIDDLPEVYLSQPLLSGKGLKSFYGVRLDNEFGKTIGMLILLGREPLDPQFKPEMVIQACATRAAAEMQHYIQLRRAKHLATLLSPTPNDVMVPQVQRPDFQEQADQQDFALGIIDQKRVLTYVNQTWVDWFGRSRETYVGHEVTDFQPHDYAQWFKQVQPIRESGQLLRYHLDMSHEDGTAIRNLVYPVAIYDDSLTQFVGSLGMMMKF